MSAHAGGRGDERLVGVPRVGDLVGRGAVEVGDYAVARMAPVDFERLIATVRNADSTSALPRPPSGAEAAG